MLLKDVLAIVDQQTEFWVNEKEFSDYYRNVQECPDEQLTSDVDYITFDSEGIITFEI